MTILRDISFLWSMLHIIALFLLLFEPRYSWRTTLLVGFTVAGTLLAVNVLAMYRLGHGVIMSAAFFTCTLPTLALFFLLSKYRDGRFFFLFCLSDTVCFWLLQITNLLDRITGDTYIMLLVSRLIAFPAMELLFWRYLRRPYRILQQNLSRGWLLFAAIGGTYYLLIMLTAIPVDAPIPGRTELMRVLLVMLLMPLTYLTVLRILWQQMQLYENNRQMELHQQEYIAISQKMELSRVYRHDFRHHMLVLEGLLQQDEAADALSYIQELTGRLTDLTDRVFCSDPTVDAVLRTYIAQAEEERCQVSAEVKVPQELPYNKIDLCIILANTLENALHACRKLSVETRRIGLTLTLTDNRRLIFSIENACPEPLEFDADGLPVVPHSENHGLGLHSVQAVVKKYNGLFQTRWSDGQFRLRIILFPPNVPTLSDAPAP